MKTAKKKIAYKYHEDETLKELQAYIDSTYGQHYALDEKVQLMDLFFAEQQEGVIFCKTNAMKYLQRFGKKEGANPKDLLKAMHYIVLMYHTLK